MQKLHLLAGKGMALKAVAKALTRSEESVKERAKTGRAEDPQAALDIPLPLFAGEEGPKPKLGR